MTLEIETLLGRRYGDLLAERSPAVLGAPAPEMVDGRGYVSRPDLGVSLVLDADQQVSTVQLYRQGHQGFDQYRGATPGGLSFETDQAGAREALGTPIESGAAKTLPLLGAMPAWDAFHVGALRLHLEYEPDGRGVRLMSVSLADAAR